MINIDNVERILLYGLCVIFVVLVLMLVLIIKLLRNKKGYEFKDSFYNMEMSLMKNDNNNHVEIIKQNNENHMKISKELKESLDVLRETNEKKLNEIRKENDEKLNEIRKVNEEKLNLIERNINEKLDKSLNERLDKSFQTIGEQLQNLHMTLGELQNLSTGVDDLKKTLTNVKTRGVFGEKQLENILENIMTKAQYETQYKINGEENRIVDFAIRIPNKDDEGDLFLPIDSKFPNDMYNKVVEASQKGNEELLIKAQNELKTAILSQAKSINEKYINPPVTTDFALMFLPTEGLYSECLRINDLCDDCQKKYKVILVGPTTITALINSLSIGFKYLKVNKYSNEINKILQAIKTQYEKFGDDILKTKDRLRLAQESTENLEKRNNMINSKLKSISNMDEVEAKKILSIESE